MQMRWSSIFTLLVAPGSPPALIFLNKALMATCFDNFFFPVHSWISHACWSIQEISSSLAFFFFFPCYTFLPFGGDTRWIRKTIMYFQISAFSWKSMFSSLFDILVTFLWVKSGLSVFLNCCTVLNKLFCLLCHEKYVSHHLPWPLNSYEFRIKLALF